MGVRQSRLQDAVVTGLIRPGMAALARSPRAQMWFLERVAPRGGPVLTGYIRGVPAESSSVYSLKSTQLLKMVKSADLSSKTPKRADYLTYRPASKRLSASLGLLP